MVTAQLHSPVVLCFKQDTVGQMSLGSSIQVHVLNTMNKQATAVNSVSQTLSLTSSISLTQFTYTYKGKGSTKEYIST